MVEQIEMDMETIFGQYAVQNGIIGTLALLLAWAFFFRKHPGKKGKSAAFFLLTVYLCFVVELTLITREAGSRVGVSLEIWGTYAPDLYARCWMIENILLFIPLGVLLPVLLGKMRNAGWMALVAFGLSITIETIQLITSRGFFQVDDIWLNVLGALVGWCLVVYYYHNGLLCSIFTVIFMALCLMIFGFSAQNGEESGSLSDMVARWVSRMLDRLLGLQIAPEKLSYPVRKTAHMSEYAILWLDTLCMLLTGRNYRVKAYEDENCMTNRDKTILEDNKTKKSDISGKTSWQNCWILSVVIVLLVAISDEFHQRFVPGRCGQPIDVVWDMTGVFLCHLVVWIVCRLYRSHA